VSHRWRTAFDEECIAPDAVAAANAFAGADARKPAHHVEVEPAAFSGAYVREVVGGKVNSEWTEIVGSMPIADAQHAFDFGKNDTPSVFSHDDDLRVDRIRTRPGDQLRYLVRRTAWPSSAD
jgi:hypothetical protein